MQQVCRYAVRLTRKSWVRWVIGRGHGRGSWVIDHWSEYREHRESVTINPFFYRHMFNYSWIVRRCFILYLFLAAQTVVKYEP